MIKGSDKQMTVKRLIKLEIMVKKYIYITSIVVGLCRRPQSRFSHTLSHLVNKSYLIVLTYCLGC